MKNLPHTPPFEQEEYDRRIAAVQAGMAERGLDVMLAATMASVCYLTGFESASPHKFTLVAVPKKGRPALLCQDFESFNSRLSSWLEPAFTYGVVEDPIASARRMIDSFDAGRSRIGLELMQWSSISTQHYLKLRDTLPEATLVDATDCVGNVMGIKSPPEVEYLRKAGRITADAMAMMYQSIHAGATDNDIAAAAYHALTKGGSEYSAYPVFVTTGVRSSVPHTTFHRTPIAAGDPVFMEIAASIQRYHTPMMRVAVPGKASPRLREMAEAAVASVNTMTQRIRPGVTADSVAAAAAECLRPVEKTVVWHGYYGYSVGLGFPPEWSDSGLCIRRGDATVLKPGMVFHCSTSLRDVGVCGATCSETILVTEGGCEVLTGKTRGVMEL